MPSLFCCDLGYPGVFSSFSRSPCSSVNPRSSSSARKTGSWRRGWARRRKQGTARRVILMSVGSAVTKQRMSALSVSICTLSTLLLLCPARAQKKMRRVKEHKTKPQRHRRAHLQEMWASARIHIPLFCDIKGVVYVCLVSEKLTSGYADIGKESRLVWCDDITALKMIIFNRL